MKKVLSTIALLGSLVIGVAAAYGGAFTQYPQVGNTQNTANPPGPAYSTTCTSTGNNGVCNAFQPFGPTSVTGNETVPADTNLVNSQGAQQQPVTVTIPTSFLMGGGVNQIVTSGAATTVSNGVASLILNGVGATEAVTLPAAPWNGQVVQIANVTSTAISTFSVAANSGQSLVGVAPTALAAQTNNSAAAAASTVDYRYNAANTTWYRIQ